MDGRGAIVVEGREIANLEITQRKMFGAGLMMRQNTRLSDVTNMPQHQLPHRLPQGMIGNENSMLERSTPAKESARLLKSSPTFQENSVLLRLLEERNQIIEINKVELQKLRLALHKEQQQNRQLARAHSQLLAELNMGKDKLKVIQHELACTKGTLKVKELIELEYAWQLNANPDDRIITKKEQSDRMIEVAGDEPHKNRFKQSHAKQKDPTKPNSSSGPSCFNLRATGKLKKNDRRRVSTRKRSMNQEPQPCDEPTEDLFELEDLDVCSSSMASNQHISTSSDHHLVEEHRHCADKNEDLSIPSSNIKCEEKIGNGRVQQPLHNPMLRTSIERPSRRTKVGICYKEKPLNTKMRRDT